MSLPYWPATIVAVHEADEAAVSREHVSVKVALVSEYIAGVVAM